MALLEQIFVAVVTIICFLLRYYFKETAEKKSGTERKKFELISVFMTIATVSGLLFILILAIKQGCRNDQIEIALAEIFLIGFVMCEIVNYKTDSLKDGFSHFLAVILPAAVAGISVLIGAGIYFSNVDEVETKKYSEQQFELVQIFNDVEQENEINVEMSISKFFKYNVEESENSEDDETVQTFEICYLTEEPEKQKLCKTIDFEDTSLKPVPEGQKPYMIVKTYTSYSINNNVDPPEECYFKDSYKYELYVPEEDIEELSKLLKKK